MSIRRRSTGFSLIEVVVFIVVLGIAFVGMLVLYNRVTSASVDPMVRKQALAIASSLLEEIELRAHTFCDPDDPNVYTATSTAGCTIIEAIGPEAGETRYSVPRFDNVRGGSKCSHRCQRDHHGARELQSRRRRVADRG